jgi:thiol-disulfide isomerase/thioredoxin
MFKKLLSIIFLGIILFVPNLVSAQETEVNLYFFWSKTCPHCAEEKVFLEKIVPEYPNLRIHDFEVGDRDAALLLQKVGEELNLETNGVPITIIGRSYFIGYLDDETTGETIRTLVEKTAAEGDPDVVGAIIRKESEVPEFQPQVATPVPTVFPTTELSPDKEEGSIPQQIKLPIIGLVDIRSLSLPVLTIIIAAMDGFNPCAMWTLLFLISLLLGMQDRKRMWILGTAFIAASALVYFLFLSAWLNFFLFLGFVFWIRMLVGLVALGAGGYYLRDYWINKEGGCAVAGDEERREVFEKIKTVIQKRQLILALGGIVLLAFAVNLVESICSAGLPAIYTKILSLSNLPTWQYYSYLLVYVLIFMLDDLFVFFAAMTTLRAVGVQSKYSRYSRLIGGILMFVIGLLLIFKPEWLMFT